MRILLVSQMYPGPLDPDLGVFVRGLEEQLVARGHEVERAVLDRRGAGKQKYLRLARTTAAASRRFQPDVVYAANSSPRLESAPSKRIRPGWITITRLHSASTSAM